jgi:hypothetical protein
MRSSLAPGQHPHRTEKGDARNTAYTFNMIEARLLGVEGVQSGTDPTVRVTSGRIRMGSRLHKGHSAEGRFVQRTQME